LIEIINKQLLLQLVGYLCYWQMGFNSVFKGLIWQNKPLLKPQHVSVSRCHVTYTQENIRLIYSKCVQNLYQAGRVFSKFPCCSSIVP